MISRSILFCFLCLIGLALINAPLVLGPMVFASSSAYPLAMALVFELSLAAVFLLALRFYRRLPRGEEVCEFNARDFQLLSFAAIGLLLVGLGLPEVIWVCQSVAAHLAIENDPSVRWLVVEVLRRSDSLASFVFGLALFGGARWVQRLWIRLRLGRAPKRE